MDRKQFWQIIETSQAQSDGDLDLLNEKLIENLVKLDLPDLAKWDQIFDVYFDLSYKNKLWAAAFAINGGCSDDGFEYFRGWLIAQGKDLFLQALQDPDSLAESLEEDYAEFEEILSAPAFVLAQKLGIKDGWERLEQEREKMPLPEAERTAILAEIVFDDEIDCEWDEGDLSPVVPKLAEKFSG